MTQNELYTYSQRQLNIVLDKIKRGDYREANRCTEMFNRWLKVKTKEVGGGRNGKT
jgi:hypothetical protein